MSVTIPATAVVTASRIGTSRCQSEYTKIVPSGTITATRMSRSRFNARSSGERGWRN